MKKKVLAVLLTAAMAATLLAGCGGSGSSDSTSSSDSGSADAAASDGQVTITMDWWGGDSRHEATMAAVEAFEAANPDIKVEVNYGAWSDWETAKAAEYVSGNNADVQQINFDWITKYDAQGTTYLDLNTVADTLDLTQWEASDLETAQDVNGGIAGVPISLTGRTFYWNQATFAAAGLEVPETLADLEAAGPVFQEQLGDNYYPLYVGEYDRAILMTYYIQAQYGDPIINQSGNLSYTQDQLAEGLAFIERLEDEHVIPTLEYINGEGAESIDKSARFIGGEYAGLFEWDSTIAKAVNALGENGDDLVVGNPFPDMGPEGTGSFVKIAQLFAISAKTEHPTECARLLNYLLNEQEGVELMSTERGIPASAAAVEILTAAGMIEEKTQAAHDAVINSNPMYWNPLFDDSNLKGTTSAYYDVFDGMSYAQGAYYNDPDAAAAALYEAMTAVAPAAN